MSLPDRLFKRLEREFLKGKARQRADKKATARRIRRLISSHPAEASPADAMEGVKETPIINLTFGQPEELSLPGVQLAILNASKVKKHKGRKAKNSSFSPPPPLSAPPAVPTLLPPSPPPQPPPPPPPLQTPAPTAAPHLERKIARLEAELFNRDKSRQKRNDAFRSMQTSEHQKMLELMDARLLIGGLETKLERLEEELEEARRVTVSWVHRAEKFKAERYEKFSHTIDPTPPPPQAIEWAILVRKPEFWAGAVGLVTILAGAYAAGKYLGDGAPAVPLSCPRQIQCPRPPRVESQRAQLCPKVECPRVECPRAPDCPTGSVLPPGEKCRGNRHLVASYALGALTGGISTWQTMQAMD